MSNLRKPREQKSRNRKRYDPSVVGALFRKARGKRSEVEICRALRVPRGQIRTLWGRPCLGVVLGEVGSMVAAYLGIPWAELLRVARVIGKDETICSLSEARTLLEIEAQRVS